MNVLIVTNYRRGKSAGGPQVNHMIARHLEAVGHQVDFYSFEDAFSRRNKFVQYMGTALFPFKAIRAVRRMETQYDLIQADQGTLPASKAYLKTNAVVVYHSHGFHYFQKEYGNRAPSRNETQGSLLGRVASYVSHKLTNPDVLIDKCIREADVISAMNRDEYAFARFHYPDKKVVLKPNGLTAARMHRLREAGREAADKLERPTVGFIGVWNPRKGALDLPEIFQAIRRRHPDVRFHLMGTGRSADVVLDDFPPSLRQAIDVTPSYAYDELPHLLRDVTVGLLPSYIEGFGLAVLEMLAASIPTAAYDVPGPRDMLGRLSANVMTPPGDTERMADTLNTLLDASMTDYQRLARQCVEVAQGFQWKDIVSDYESHVTP
jgi:glycosyltransferase involved in cell wall biosynthesis